MPQRSSSRRMFLKGSSVLAGASLLTGAAPARQEPAEAAGDRALRLALVGCGGRGTGAAAQALATARDVEQGGSGGPVRLVAMADAFADRLESSLSTLKERFGDAVEVPAERRFVGLDAFERALEVDVDVVVLATPPGFRPQHFARAVELGRHVFMEKPVAVDAPGVRAVLAAAEAAREQGLKVGVGLQRHHSRQYQETVQRLRDGAIGRPALYRVYWNSAGVWVHPRGADETEMEYQLRNWYYFNWLCGDHIVEQHIHNLDVGNWVQGAVPVQAQGQGGRQVRTGADHGEIFDHHMVEYTYADGTVMLSQCRHVPDTWSSVSEHVHGSEGTADVSAGRIRGGGGWSWRYEGPGEDPYQVEHDVLFRAIREGTPHAEAVRGAQATMTAILGRMATYSGQLLSWDEALASELSLSPERLAFDAPPPTLPGPDGHYPVPVPGVTRVV